MRATVRSIEAEPGQIPAGAALIRSEYLPLPERIDGVVSYALVGTGDDTVSSLGVFTDAAADAADAARARTADRLADLVESPLSAGAGEVRIAHSTATSSPFVPAPAGGPLMGRGAVVAVAGCDGWSDGGVRRGSGSAGWWRV